MKRKYSDSFSKPIDMFYSEYLKDGYILTPDFQRDEVWSKEEKSYFIDTLMKGLPVPMFYIAKKSNVSDSKYMVVDGKQRLKAIIDFYQNKISLPADFDKDELGCSILNSCTYDDILNLIEDDATVKEYWDDFKSYTLPMILINDPTDEILTDIFDRLNRGRVLNIAEKIHGKYVHTALYQAIKDISSSTLFKKYAKTCRELNCNRMLDVFFASSLFFTMSEEQVVGGSEKTISKLYANKKNALEDDVRETYDEVMAVWEFLDTLNIDLSRMRINKPSHLYTLFVFSAYCIKHNIVPSNDIQYKIIEFYNKYRDRDFRSPPIKKYSDNIQNSANLQYARKNRVIALAEYCGIYYKSPAFKL